jgi:hypothetical protein
MAHRKMYHLLNEATTPLRSGNFLAHLDARARLGMEIDHADG